MNTPFLVNLNPVIWFYHIVMMLVSSFNARKLLLQKIKHTRSKIDLHVERITILQEAILDEEQKLKRAFEEEKTLLMALKQNK